MNCSSVTQRAPGYIAAQMLRDLLARFDPARPTHTRPSAGQPLDNNALLNRVELRIARQDDCAELLGSRYDKCISIGDGCAGFDMSGSEDSRPGGGQLDQREVVYESQYTRCLR